MARVNACPSDLRSSDRRYALRNTGKTRCQAPTQPTQIPTPTNQTPSTQKSPHNTWHTSYAQPAILDIERKARGRQSGPCRERQGYFAPGFPGYFSLCFHAFLDLGTTPGVPAHEGQAPWRQPSPFRMTPDLRRRAPRHDRRHLPTIPRGLPSPIRHSRYQLKLFPAGGYQR
jgi:hypothetical protein